MSYAYLCCIERDTISCYDITAKNSQSESNHGETSDKSKCPEGHSTKVSGLYSLNMSRL